MFDDNQEEIAARFFQQRSRQLWGRYDGYYRAYVAETNDPLIMHRVRFKCPDLHDWSLKPEDCPWAIPANAMGGKRAGSWTHPCIGDWIWITFERGHPYAAIWVGFADPTRRKFYPYPAVFGVTPLPVDKESKPDKKPDDYYQKYLPKDSRPMSGGFQDRYGHLDLFSSVGYFPTEHNVEPPPSDIDPIQDAEFGPKGEKPKVNDPDSKMIVRISKYGNIFMLGDQGYHWQKGESGSDDSGEFNGDVDKDEPFESKRWFILQDILHEGQPTGVDQRRIMALTRYGHKFEMRDVGWDKTRDGEYGKPRTISKAKANQGTDAKDQRWIKLRTKGGMLFQLYDKGFDSVEDSFVKRAILDEVGGKGDFEDYWQDKTDARQIRLFTRYGFKLVLDDRGSDRKNAQREENPHGLGILLKGRRTPAALGMSASGDPRGYFWEFNERDEQNQTTWGTPLGIVMQMSDKWQYILLSSRKSSYPRPWANLIDNEFLGDSLREQGAEYSTHHLKIDHHNEYIRLKSRSGRGDAPWGMPVNPAASGIQQGLEIRDGSKGDGPWVELVDRGGRGIWFSSKGFITCRAAASGDGSSGNRPSNMSWWFNEGRRELVLDVSEAWQDPAKTPQAQWDAFQQTPPRIQLYCANDVEIIAMRNVNVMAYDHAQVKAGGTLSLVAAGGGTVMELTPAAINCTKPIIAPGFGPAFPAVSPLNDPVQRNVPQLSPTDRGAQWNGN